MLRLHLTNETQDLRLEHPEGPLLVGRAPGAAGARLVVEDLRVSRRQMRLEAVSASTVRLEVLGKRVRLADGSHVERGETVELPLPLRVEVGRTRIDLSGERQDVGLLTIAPPVSTERTGSSTLASLGAAPPPEALARWFETLVTVQSAAATSDAFLERTARAVVELVGLDRGLVLERDGEEWSEVARHAASPEDTATVSRTVLAEVVRRRRTFFDRPRGADLAQSLMQVEAVVASPVIGAEGEVVGAVYGSRDARDRRPGRAITPLEAQVVQLLAAAVSAGLSRLAQEAEAVRLRVQFAEFFSPALARELERNPRLLEATEREVTVLFSDVRGFSALAEQLAPETTYAVTADLLDVLTQHVLGHGGVVVDYYGDGLEAMWNAPTDQPDHAELACRAALAMQAELPRLNERWRHELPGPLRVGIGVHCGRALVGNAGSSRRVKYGPRGHVVNLASRVEGATKPLEVGVLVSGAVRERLGATILTRRLGRALVAGVDEPVELHELPPDAADEAWQALRSAHERAVALWEAGDTAAAAEVVAAAREGPAGAGDGPLAALERALAEPAALPRGVSFDLRRG